MKKLWSNINYLKKKFSDNIEGNFADVYEDSLIAKVDNEVIIVVKGYFEYIVTMKEEADELQSVAEEFKYKNTSASLLTLSSNISNYENIYSEIPKDILKASKQAFEKLLSEFNENKKSYNVYIQDADKFYNQAKSSLNERNKYNKNNPDERESYTKYDNMYIKKKKYSEDSILKAEKYYETLVSLIDNGLKKFSKSIQNDSLSEETTDDEQNVNNYVEKFDCTIKINNGANLHGTFTGLVDEDGIPLEGEFISDYGDKVIYKNGKILSEGRYYYSAVGGHLSRFLVTTYNEDGNVVSKEYNDYSEDGTIEEINTETYNEDGNIVSEEYNYYYEDGSIKKSCTKRYNEDGTIEKSFTDTYNKDGTTQTSSGYRYNKDGTIQASSISTYNEEGIKEKNENYYLFDNGISDNLITTYENDNVKLEEGYYYCEDGITPAYHYVTEYNENGNMVSKKETFYCEDGITPSLQYLTEYKGHYPNRTKLYDNCEDEISDCYLSIEDDGPVFHYKKNETNSSD